LLLNLQNTYERENMRRVALSMSCDNLRNKDFGSKSDPFVIVYEAIDGDDGPQKFVETARSEIVMDNLKPSFPPVEHSYEFNRRQNLKFVVQDYDSSGKHDDLGESQVVTMAELIKNVKTTLTIAKRSLHSDSTITIHVEEIAISKETYYFDFRGEDIAKAGLMTRPDPMLYISREAVNEQNDEKNNVIVYRGPHCKSTKTPNWDPFTISATQLCNGDERRKLTFTVYDFENDGGHRFIGSFTTTVRDLKMSQIGRKFEIVDEKGKLKGVIILERFNVSTEYSMVDFIQAGATINVVHCVDCTGSNGPINERNSLHHLNAGLTPYEWCMQGTNNVLGEYDSDKQFPVYGFGANVDGRNVYDWYGGTASDTAGLLKIYREMLHKCRLSGPTYVMPLVELISQLVASKKGEYTVMIIHTDGALNDFAELKQWLRTNSWIRMSILFIGIGAGPFGELEKLDDAFDNNPGVRDMVDFVKYDPNPVALARKVLAEVPRHLEDYAKHFGRTPETFKDGP